MFDYGHFKFEDKQALFDKAIKYWNPDKTKFWQKAGIDLVIDRREGYCLFDMDGRRLIDLHDRPGDAARVVPRSRGLRGHAGGPGPHARQAGRPADARRRPDGARADLHGHGSMRPCSGAAGAGAGRLRDARAAARPAPGSHGSRAEVRLSLEPR